MASRSVNAVFARAIMARDPNAVVRPIPNVGHKGEWRVELPAGRKPARREFNRLFALCWAFVGMADAGCGCCHRARHVLRA